MENFLLGTSGYDYPEWRGVFYPADLKRKDFLIFYSTVFNALELNFSFYGMPTAQRIFSFYERSEGRLSFSIKANRSLTHEVSRSWKNDAKEFKQAVFPVYEKDALCALLFQFPETFTYTKENRLYLAELLKEFDGLPCVVEFRCRNWLQERVLAGLEERNASLVFCDMPMQHLAQTSIISKYANGAERCMPRHPLVNADCTVGKTAYIRLHGRNENAWYAKASVQNPSDKNGSGRYRYNYSDEELIEFVPIIRSGVDSGKRTMVFFNNHPDGSGAQNARRLGEMMGLCVKPEESSLIKV